MQCLPRVASAVHDGMLIVGHGFIIEVYHHDKLRRSIPIFRRNGGNIYGIVPDKGSVVFLFILSKLQMGSTYMENNS